MLKVFFVPLFLTPTGDWEPSTIFYPLVAPSMTTCLQTLPELEFYLLVQQDKEFVTFCVNAATEEEAVEIAKRKAANG